MISIPHVWLPVSRCLLVGAMVTLPGTAPAHTDFSAGKSFEASCRFAAYKRRVSRVTLLMHIRVLVRALPRGQYFVFIFLEKRSWRGRR